MSEKGEKNELSFSDTDVLHTPQKGIKLDKLSPAELIPGGLVNVPKVVGPLNAVMRRSQKNIRYIITDETKIDLHQKESAAGAFLEMAELENFPELKRGEGQYARPILYGTIGEISPGILYSEFFATNPALRGAGVIFQEHLASLAKQLGYKFLVGYQNSKDAVRFFLKRGRYLLDEVKDEHQEEFRAPLRPIENAEDPLWWTVKFLYPEDIAKYIKPERVDTDVENKLEFKKKISLLKEIFNNLSALLKKVEEKRGAEGDKATLIEIMEDLHQILPEEARYALPELSEDDPQLILTLKVLLEYLKNKSSILIREATLDQLRENIV